MRALAVIGAFVGATVLAYIIILFGYSFYADAFQVRDFEGATAMGVAFAIGPATSVLIGIVAAIVVGMRKPRAK